MVHILTKETSSGLMPTTFSYKAAVKCATIANGTLATAYAAGQVVDGYTLIAGDRILIKDQSPASQNGVYTVNATGAPTRATDMNAATMFPGAVVAVQGGTVNADSGWVCTADAGIVLETSDIVWALFGGLKAGLNLAITADVIAVTALNMATVTGIAVTGTPIFSMGNLDTAYASTKVANFIPVQVSISQGADIGTGNTVGAGYFRTATGIAQTGQLATLMVRTALGHNVFDAYGLQSHISITASMATVDANAHLTAISGKITLTGTPTVSKGWGTAGLFILEGAGSFTQMCSCVSLVQESGCAAAKEMLYINNDGTATVGINFVGNFTKGINFANGTFSQGTANACLAYGDIGTTKSLTPTDSIVPFQCNITSVADSGTSGDQTIGATYFRTATSTASQPNHQLATCMVRVKVANNIWDAYGVQSHLSFGNVTVETTGANAHLTAISGKVTFDTTTVTKGWVTAGLFIIEGAGTCSQMCHGVSIVEEAGSTGAQSMLHLNTDVGTTPYFSFAGADGTGKSIYTHTAAGTQLGTIKILVGGVERWIPFMQAE